MVWYISGNRTAYLQIPSEVVRSQLARLANGKANYMKPFVLYNLPICALWTNRLILVSA